jgi:3-oxoacyl-[acyl-carrier-protein] reductase
MRKLEGRIALITGCNRGIGKAIMEKFMEEGAGIVACTRQMTPELKEYYQQKEKQYNIKIRPLLLDLVDEDSIKLAMKELYSWKLRVDILVNNAGIALGGFMLMTSIVKMKEIFQINYFSQVLLTQYILKMMIKNKNGNILFMSSVLGLDARVGATSYGASKAAIALLTKSLSKEVAAYNIRVNALAPNLVDTEMAYLMEKKSFSNMIDSSALNRLATPEEVANVALFLASDDSSYITGQVIRVDGGL